MNASNYGCCEADCYDTYLYLSFCDKLVYSDCGLHYYQVFYNGFYDSHSYYGCTNFCPYPSDCYVAPPTPTPTPAPSDPEENNFVPTIILISASMILCLVLTLVCCMKKSRRNAENGVAQRNLQNADAHG